MPLSSDQLIEIMAHAVEPTIQRTRAALVQRGPPAPGLAPQYRPGGGGGGRLLWPAARRLGRAFAAHRRKRFRRAVSPSCSSSTPCWATPRACRAAKRPRTTRATRTTGSWPPRASSAAPSRWRPAARWPCGCRHTDHVVVCFFGDGATNRGDFHEALNLAAVLKAPVSSSAEQPLRPDGPGLGSDGDHGYRRPCAGIRHAGPHRGRAGCGGRLRSDSKRRGAGTERRRADLARVQDLPFRPALPHL